MTMSPSDGREPRSSDAGSERIRLLQAVIASLITALTTITVTYITVVKPATKQAAAESVTQKFNELAAPVRIVPDGVVRPNDAPQRLLIYGYCNATAQSKDLEGWIGASPESLRLVATSSGTDRISITFLVPPRWYYRVRYNDVPGIGSDFSGWRF